VSLFPRSTFDRSSGSPSRQPDDLSRPLDKPEDGSRSVSLVNQLAMHESVSERTWPHAPSKSPTPRLVGRRPFGGQRGSIARCSRSTLTRRRTHIERRLLTSRRGRSPSDAGHRQSYQPSGRSMTPTTERPVGTTTGVCPTGTSMTLKPDLAAATAFVSIPPTRPNGAIGIIRAGHRDTWL